MTQIDQIIADALAGSPETHVAILAREVVRLRESPAVVVPEIMLSDISNECGAMLCDDREAFRRGALWAQKFITSRLRPIPADRVLGEGMVALRRFAERCAQRDHQPDEHIGSAKCVACEAEDALRANHGGADHD
jgi:hypothetical protein